MEIKANIPGKGLAHVEVRDDKQIVSLSIVGPPNPERPYLSPGFVDIQVNGFAGVDFSDPKLEPEDLVNILPDIWKSGVTSFCPTLITNTLDCLERNFRTLEKARKLDAAFFQSVPGYHLEGPYLSPGGACGAHNPSLMRLPDWNEFLRLQEAAGGNIAIVTLAPELRGACEFIRRARAAGVVVAIGHTDAGPEHIHMAIEAGAELSTHLGNGCANLIHRHRNPLWAQIASDQLHASLICDGFHLPLDLVRAVVRAKGIGRCILVTDAVHVVTMPPGRYSLVDREIDLLTSGQVVTADRQSMAGSALSMNRAVVVFETFAQISLSKALQAASTNPGTLLATGSRLS